ncbi:pentatricopeptide repeat-containing protein [Canna indica]|uniref:Pentatricopeptide repeat-containing protein n=1 Tax=Canna indica TaxID=4628 RepID=A0AAQ3QI98_9LILI|nr:pentatricopeptide repeat-containing protein [Canna indica]
MHSLSTFHTSGTSIPASYIEYGTSLYPRSLRRRRKKGWGLGLPFFSCCNCPCQSSISSGISKLIRQQNLCWRSWFLVTDLKLSSSEMSRVPSRKYFTLALALDHEQLGSERVEERPKVKKLDNQVDCAVSDGAETGGIFDGEEGRKEKAVDIEENDHTNGNLFDEKGKVDVRALSLSLKHAKSADDVEEVFKNLHDLPLPVYSSMIRGFGVDKRLDSAFALVEWLKRKNKETQSSLSPNLFIYNSLLSAVKLTRQFDKIDKVIQDMEAQGIVPNIVTYNTLMSVYLEQGRHKDALNVLNDIKNNGLYPSPVTYSTILLAYRKMGDAHGALSYFAQLREKYQRGEIGKDSIDEWDNEFVKLEKFTVSICYLVMRQWLVNEENAAANVLNLLSVMDDTRVKPSRVDYERLVWACTCESHYIVAKELYRRIRGMSNDISLSVCNHVIWLMGKAKKWWAALEIYEDLLDKGPKPNNLSNELIISHFNILLTAARKKGIWRWGIRLLNKMQEKGLRPGSREWNAVLVACSKASETSVAIQIFMRMVEEGEKPTALSYGALLSALEKGRLYDEALRVWDHMCKVGVKPNLYAYTILVSVYIGKGSTEMIDSVFREMRSVGIEPTVVTFNAIITACAKNGMGSAAFEWFHRMKIQNIKPNEVTYEMLVEALARDGKPRLAYEIYLRACNEGLHLSSKAYDAVLESCDLYGISMNSNDLGPRPQEKRSDTRIYRNLSDFSNSAGLPRRGRWFDEKEIYP